MIGCICLEYPFFATWRLGDLNACGKNTYMLWVCHIKLILPQEIR